MSRRRVKLQLNVAGGSNQLCSGGPDPLERLDSRHVCRHQIREIDQQRAAFGAGFEEFRNLRDTQTAGQSHDTTIDFIDDTNPTVHDN